MYGTTEIAAGTSINDLQYLGQYDDSYNEGDYYQLHLNFSIPIAAELAGRVSQAITDAGYIQWQEVYTDGGTLVIKAQKGIPFPFALVIPIILAILAGILIVLFISWVLYRLAQLLGLTSLLDLGNMPLLVISVVIGASLFLLTRRG